MTPEMRRFHLRNALRIAYRDYLKNKPMRKEVAWKLILLGVFPKEALEKFSDPKFVESFK